MTGLGDVGLAFNSKIFGFGLEAQSLGALALKPKALALA